MPQELTDAQLEHIRRCVAPRAPPTPPPLSKEEQEERTREMRELFRRRRPDPTVYVAPVYLWNVSFVIVMGAIGLCGVYQRGLRFVLESIMTPQAGVVLILHGFISW